MEITYKTATKGLNTYPNAKDDLFLEIVKEHEKTKKKDSVVSQATIFRREPNLPETLEPENEAP